MRMDGKDRKELQACLQYLEEEKGIDRESLLTLLEGSILSAAKKAIRSTREVTVTIARDTLEVKCEAKLFVVDPVEDPDDEISLQEAQTKYPNAKIGDEVQWEVTPKDFGRIAAQAAKNAIIQGLHQAERKNVCDAYREQIGQLISGEVRRLDREGIIINFGQADGLLRRDERIPGESFEAGDLVTAILLDMNPDPGAPLLVSRATPEFVRKLFEREVTEISDGLVEIKSVAREPGYRSKIAVASHEQRIDPVGACVGMRGQRVRTIVHELGGEKVDIIEWSQDVATYVTNALKPAKLLKIQVDEARKTVHVEVEADQLSLSIGKKGQNARLASRLTGWRIDITAAAPEASPEDKLDTQIRRAIEKIGAVEGIGPESAEILVRNGFPNLEGIVAQDAEDIAKLPGLDHERAAAILAAAKAALGQ